LSVHRILLLQRKRELGHTKPATGPHAARGLDLAGLDSRSYVEIVPFQIHLTMPKFRLDFGKDLRDILEEMGIEDLFIPGVADLSGINNQRTLNIDAAEHKTFLEVTSVLQRLRDTNVTVSFYFGADFAYKRVKGLK